MGANLKLLFKKYVKQETGYTLVEMLIYIAILSIMLLLIISTIMSFIGPYRDVITLRSLDQAGIDALERISRQVRAATTVDTSNSTFGINPGVLVIDEGVSATTTRFYLQNNQIQMDLNGVYNGPLTGSSTSVTNLTFYLLSTTTAKAIRIDLTLQATSSSVRTKTFHSTVILRGS